MTHALVAVWSVLDYRVVTGIKAAVAVLGAVVLAWELVLPPRASPDRSKRYRDWALGALGVVSLVCWWNFGRFNYPDYVHVAEHLHYFLGAKYFPELGYTRLYECTAAADLEAGLQQDVARRWMRNLVTNELVTGEAIVRDRTICTKHFSPERWAMFTRDVAWFRQHRTPDTWRLAQMDHGYNATPVWGMVGAALASTGEASTPRILALALLDPVLILVMWGFVWWAFGWRAMCVALIWWGTNYPGRFWWTGGAFLRADWLALSTIGVCLVKRRHLVSGGFALTYAALLRIFPGFMVVSLVLRAGVRVWRARSATLQAEDKAFAVGCLAALALLVPLSVFATGGLAAGGLGGWPAFFENSRKHLDTPLSNNVGLKTVLSFSQESRIANLGGYWLDSPWDTWKGARRRVFEERRPLFWLLVAGYVALLAAAVKRQEAWVALAVGVGLIPVAVELTCYYYAVLLITAFLWTRWPWIGVALCALSAASSLIPAIWSIDDDIYTVFSALTLLYVFAVAIQAAIASRSEVPETTIATTM